tara:strand:- start:517 stop:975 length:459 start_codon:yes stop_codon:yes gene_type:complete
MNLLCRCFSTKIVRLEDTIKFVPNIKKCTVISVYDGDTITIASKLPYRNSPVYRWSLRIYGIDCPEMRTRNETEKNIAQIAQKKLEGLILHKTVELKDIKYDKYGRLLSDVYYNKKSISDMMLTERLAVPYFGKKKEPPVCWKKYYETGELK